MALARRLCGILFIIGLCHGITVPTVRLLNGYEMPVVGLGTFQMSPEQVDVAITAALKNGYRHIDTAFIYENEKDIGSALQKWFDKGGKREDLFITTKLPIIAMRPEDVSKALNLSLTNLGLDYIDMYLIHVPFGTYRTSDFKFLFDENGFHVIDYSTDLVAVWKEMENQVKAGKVRSIGLSNFNKTQILRIWENADVKPTNLQVENNAYIQQCELYELCKNLGIVMTGYSPLGSNDLTHLRKKRETKTYPALLRHPDIETIARHHKRSPAQVLLRYSLQRNIVVIPKSTNPKRIKENIDVFDFKLLPIEMKLIESLDLHGKYRKFDFLSFKGLEHHPEYPFTDKISQ